MIPLANAVTEVHDVALPSATSLDVNVTVLFLESPFVANLPLSAVCVAVEIGLSASDVLFTFPSPILDAVIFTFPRLYEVSELPLIPVTGLPANTSQKPSKVLKTFAPSGTVYPAPSLNLSVVTNSLDMLYIQPLTALSNDGKSSNETVPIGTNAPLKLSDIDFACS